MTTEVNLGGRPSKAEDLSHPNQMRALAKGWWPVTVAYDLESSKKIGGLTERDMFERAKIGLSRQATARGESSRVREVCTHMGTELWMAPYGDEETL